MSPMVVTSIALRREDTGPRAGRAAGSIVLAVPALTPGRFPAASQNTVYTPGGSQRQNGVDRFVHSDWLGSTRYLSDSTGNQFPSGLRYDAFGQRSATRGPAHPTDFQFAGAWDYQTEYADGTEPGLGLQYLEQRYYDAATGRFISQDSIGFAGGINLYGYCGGNPVGAGGSRRYCLAHCGRRCPERCHRLCWGQTGRTRIRLGRCGT